VNLRTIIFPTASLDFSLMTQWKKIIQELNANGLFPCGKEPVFICVIAK
jgi:hypothetical protein